jgi:hypothetical protein
MTEGQFLYVSAQNQGGGHVRCNIYVDGQFVQSNDGNGQYAICSASGTL